MQQKMALFDMDEMRDALDELDCEHDPLELVKPIRRKASKPSYRKSKVKGKDTETKKMPFGIKN